MKVIFENDPKAVDLALDFLRAGKIISFATDTVYGIAVDATNSKAVEDLYKIKKRDKNKPIAVFLPDLLVAEKIFIFDKVAQKIAKNFAENSLTLVLKKLPNPLINLASNLNENDEFLGFRIVNTNFVANLSKSFSGILAVTSANISGEEAAISADQVKKYFNFSEMGLLIDGGICLEKIPSTVIKVDDEKITILRQGKNFEKILI